jgi:hypothetical protein
MDQARRVSFREKANQTPYNLSLREGGSEFVNCAEMMVVVLGHEETEVSDRHRLPQARMQGSPRKVGGSHSREPVDDSAARGAKICENLRDRAIVMGGLVCFAILEIGRVQLRGPGVVIIQPQVPQRFEIEKVTGIFLDGPLALAPPGQDLRRQPANSTSQPFRREAEPFQKFGSGLGTEAELKLAVEPASLCHANTN